MHWLSTSKIIIETWAALNIVLIAVAAVSYHRYQNLISDLHDRDQHNRGSLLRERELTDRLLDGALNTAHQTRSIPFDAATIRGAFTEDPRSAAAGSEPFPYNPFDDPRYNDLTMKPGAEA